MTVRHCESLRKRHNRNAKYLGPSGIAGTLSPRREMAQDAKWKKKMHVLSSLFINSQRAACCFNALENSLDRDDINTVIIKSYAFIKHKMKH